METYDLIVIGGGPAGYNAAAYAAENGLSVILFEKRELGGTCLNEGCVPSKTFLNSAKIYNYVMHSENYGVNVPDKGAISQEFVVDRKNKVVKRLVVGVKSKLKGAGVTVVKESAKIVGKDGNMFSVVAADTGYLSKNVLLAAGSRPFLPNIVGLADANSAGRILTNENIFDLREIPQNLTIIGGGVIGLEMANYFAVAGSKVTVIEALDKIAGATDEAVTAVLKKALEKQGVEFILGAKVCEITADGVAYDTAEGRSEIVADKILVSVGRRAVVDNLGLDTVGVELNRGAVVTDAHMRTNVTGIYAAGDINGKAMLAHTAYREGEVAVNDMLGRVDEMDYNSIPSVIYTSPEVGTVGYTLDAAVKAGINAKEISVSLMYSGRYIAENTDYTGICKLVYDNDKNTLIGAHIVGSYASEYIVSVSNLINLAVSVDAIKKLVFPHPTVCEVIREAVFEL